VLIKSLETNQQYQSTEGESYKVVRKFIAD